MDTDPDPSEERRTGVEHASNVEVPARSTVVADVGQCHTTGL